jgi:DNA-binding NarL/FixJ family response regulator
MPADTVIVWGALGTALMALALNLFQQQQLKRMGKKLSQLAATQVSVQSGFGGSLSQAEQRRERQNLPQENGAQRYRQVAELMQQGQGAQEIAEVLQLPETAVEQLLALAQLKRNQADPGC